MVSIAFLLYFKIFLFACDDAFKSFKSLGKRAILYETKNEDEGKRLEAIQYSIAEAGPFTGIYVKVYLCLNYSSFTF